MQKLRQEDPRHPTWLRYSRHVLNKAKEIGPAKASRQFFVRSAPIFLVKEIQFSIVPVLVFERLVLEHILPTIPCHHRDKKTHLSISVSCIMKTNALYCRIDL